MAPRGYARNALLRRGIVRGDGVPRSRQHPVLPIRADEPQVLLGRALNRLVMNPLDTLGIDWPWLMN